MNRLENLIAGAKTWLYCNHYLVASMLCLATAALLLVVIIAIN
jgi:hypothetical protein